MLRGNSQIRMKGCLRARKRAVSLLPKEEVVAATNQRKTVPKQPMTEWDVAIVKGRVRL